MERIKLSGNDNIKNLYGPTPTLPFDIEGILVEKSGKDVKIEKTLDNKNVIYSLKLKEELVENIGDLVQVEKENIHSSKIEEKEDKEAIYQDKEEVKSAEEIIRDLGLEYNESNIRLIEYLLRNGIRIICRFIY